MFFLVSVFCSGRLTDIDCLSMRCGVYYVEFAIISSVAFSYAWAWLLVFVTDPQPALY